MPISQVRIPVAEPTSAVSAGAPGFGDAVRVMWIGRMVCRIPPTSKEPASCDTEIGTPGGIDRITPAGAGQDLRVGRSAVGRMAGAS
ncbi:hypothetical protein [Skermanella aerolata]|uniref:hypothetical protein n=1 Tax=Skermanella aerolata TaxID=393310 RepID=UPI0005DABA56|nr:hypothetical protein [Skermanella aerolata]KJB90130.1 hypothetical protein N826_06210 [Skermanella aerolata KACC 11604]